MATGNRVYELANVFKNDLRSRFLMTRPGCLAKCSSGVLYKNQQLNRIPRNFDVRHLLSEPMAIFLDINLIRFLKVSPLDKGAPFCKYVI